MGSPAVQCHETLGCRANIGSRLTRKAKFGRMDNNFVSTAHMHAGDTSVDTSEDIHRHSETQEVRKTFGEVGECH